MFYICKFYYFIMSTNICYRGFSVGHGRSQEDIYKDLQSAGAG